MAEICCGRSAFKTQPKADRRRGDRIGFRNREQVEAFRDREISDPSVGGRNRGSAARLDGNQATKSAVPASMGGVRSASKNTSRGNNAGGARVTPPLGMMTADWVSAIGDEVKDRSE